MKKRTKHVGLVLLLVGVGALLFGCSQLFSPRDTLAPMGFPEDASSRAKVLIAFAGPPEQAQLAAIRDLGGEIRYVYHLVPAVAATVPGIVVRDLRGAVGAIRVEPDIRIFATDTELDNSWGVKRIGSGTVHDGSNTGSGIKIAIIDSGIDYNHPDLDGNFAGGYDFVNDDGDPMDDYGHGTHVAGTVAAEDNGVGVVGVAPGASLYGLKILGNSGSGSFSDAIAALQWCVDNGIHITNNSYGSDQDPGVTVREAFDNAALAGVLHVSSAGNTGNPPGRGDNVGYPASYDSVIAVAATDDSDKRARFSSTGQAVELAAPGVDVNSTKLGGGYVEYDGTSMACPHVAGAAALVMAAGVSDVRTQLQNTADDLGDPGRDSHYGYGLVDAAEAAGAPLNESPAVTITNPADGSTFDSGATILFEGTATDPEDGALTADLAWTSSIDGQIGTGGSFSRTLSDGSHTITVEVTDSGGKTTSLSVGITVGTPHEDANHIYVWAIEFSEKRYGRGGSKADLMTTVTIRRDSDADGIVEDSDELVSNARVEMTLGKDTGESWSFAGDTGDGGTATFTLKLISPGVYTATVTSVTHSTYTYDSAMSVETTDTHTVE